MLDEIRDESYFHMFLKARRKTMKISLRELCDGICSISAVQRMENDEIIPEKLVRNRVIARLGISGEKYEDYLPPEEYERWILRQDILKYIGRKELQKAEELLEVYGKDLEERKTVEKQFILAMEFMILQMKNAPIFELRAVIEKAVKVTVDMEDDTFPEYLLLADQELNLLIEYVALHGDEMTEEVVLWRLQEYEKIITYMENSCIDHLGKVKIYPKVVYYWLKLNCDYYEKYSLEIPKEVVERGLELCNKAIELLRDTMKLFYFMELLELRKFFCCEKLKYVSGEEAEKLNEMISVTDAWYDVVMKLYKEYQVVPYMEHFCHVYWEVQSYPLGEVVKTRRQMMGMTKEELSQDTCDLKSLTRCEKKRVKTQKYNVRGMFPKVGLGIENICGNVVTSDADALELFHNITRYANIGDLKSWEKCLEELEAKLNLYIPENKQVINMSRNLLLWYKKMISDEELQVNGVNSLENTITWDDIIGHEKRYLTQKEVYCLYSIARSKKVEVQEEYLSILKEIFEEYERMDCVTPHILEYEFIMTEISSWLGNVGKYDESNNLSRRVIKECLRHRRVGMLSGNFYHILWNNHKIKEEQSIQDRKLLEECRILSEIPKNKKWENFLIDKIAEIK